MGRRVARSGSCFKMITVVADLRSNLKQGHLSVRDGGVFQEAQAGGSGKWLDSRFLLRVEQRKNYKQIG